VTEPLCNRVGLRLDTLDVSSGEIKACTADKRNSSAMEEVEAGNQDVLAENQVTFYPAAGNWALSLREKLGFRCGVLNRYRMIKRQLVVEAP
jgi:hypothetical protein